MREVENQEIVIIGAGPAGLGLANKLTRPYVLLESEDMPGGLMRSKNLSGYVFDWAGHIFFTNFPRIREWVLELMGENFHFH